MADTQSGAPLHEEAQTRPNLIPGVKHVIAVSSGKGGVGKSEVWRAGLEYVADFY